MSGKGLLWSSEQIETLLDVWADENIKTQLENTLKGVVQDFQHRTSFSSEPVCHSSVETVFKKIHPVLTFG